MAPGNTIRRLRSQSSGAQPMASVPVRTPSTRSPHSSASQSMNASNQEALAPVRNIRKSTVNNFLKKYRKETNNSKPRIEIEPGLGTPLGEWAQTFITEMNIIVRQNTPLSCHDWRILTMDEKREIFQVPILDKFDMDPKKCKNTQSRKGLVVPHCAVSLSFVRFQAKKGLDRIALYKQTHFSEYRGAWVAPLAQERHEAMVVRRDEATSENSPPPNETQICNEVLGVRRGYTCGLGHGVMPPSYPRISRNNPVVGELQRNVEEANRRLEAAERHNEETERLRVESERQNAELRAQVQALQSFQARMEPFMAQMGPMQWDVYYLFIYLFIFPI